MGEGADAAPILLPWMWHRPAAAALVRPLAWETPYALGVALKKKKKQKISLASWGTDVKDIASLIARVGL